MAMACQAQQSQSEYKLAKPSEWPSYGLRMFLKGLRESQNPPVARQTLNPKPSIPHPKP